MGQDQQSYLLLFTGYFLCMDDDENDDAEDMTTVLDLRQSKNDITLLLKMHREKDHIIILLDGVV